LTTPIRRSVAFLPPRSATVGLPFGFGDALLAQRRRPLARKRIFRLPAPAPTTIYVRPGYNRVLAGEFEALKVKRVGLVIQG